MSRALAVLPLAVVDELEQIDAARDEAFSALRAANRSGELSESIAALHAFERIDRRVRELHRRAWPRHRGELVVALGSASLVSETGRHTLVWEKTS